MKFKVPVHFTIEADTAEQAQSIVKELMAMSAGDFVVHLGESEKTVSVTPEMKEFLEFIIDDCTEDGEVGYYEVCFGWAEPYFEDSSTELLEEYEELVALLGPDYKIHELT